VQHLQREKGADGKATGAPEARPRLNDEITKEIVDQGRRRRPPAVRQPLEFRRKDARLILESSYAVDHARLPPGAVKTVGRTARADFIVDAALVSRLHCH
jgi:hypothetical protein